MTVPRETCLKTSNIAGPCSVCGKYVRDVLHYFRKETFCPQCCPTCKEKP